MVTHKTIALLPGDGIGPEVVEAAKEVIEASHVDVSFRWLEAGWHVFEKTGKALPDKTVSEIQQCDGALFGAVSSPSHPVAGYSSPIIDLRKQLDLYANLRPVTSAPIEGSRADIDLLIVRENTEGLYVRQERMDEGGQRAVAERVISRRASERIVQMAFEQARLRKQSSGRDSLITVVHKANVLRITDGLFRKVAYDVKVRYPDVQIEEQLVDSMVYRLILEPERYDVIVAPNLYGDILSDAAAALVGGLGLVPSANVGDSFVLAEPVHGSAPDIAGRYIANPVATIRAGALLLSTLGFPNEAQKIEMAVNKTLTDGPLTADLGGRARTGEMTTAIIRNLDA